MGRKCSTVFDGMSCDSGYVTSDYECPIFSSPPGEERERWVNAPPNYIDVNKITRWMGNARNTRNQGTSIKSYKVEWKKADPPSNIHYLLLWSCLDQL